MLFDNDLLPLVDDYFRSGAAQQDMEDLAMNFVKLGKRIVNLSNVTEVRYKPEGGYSNTQPCVLISFVGETENYISIYRNEEPEAFSALMTWMGEQPALLSDER